MSVTFFVNQNPSSFTVECSCGSFVYPHVFDSYVEASLTQQTAEMGCEDEYCRAFPASVCVGFAFGETLNVASVNAKFILDTLNYEVDTQGDVTGSASGEDFFARVMMGLTAHEVPATGAGFASEDDEYLNYVLNELHTIAEYAYANELEVVWG